MGMPSGEIVARPLVARACGCLREFQEFAKDRYREQRLCVPPCQQPAANRPLPWWAGR